MRATQADRARLEAEIQRLVDQLVRMGAVRVVLFGSLARGEISLFSDIDLIVLFEEDVPARELTRRVYQRLDAREAVDVLAYGPTSFKRMRYHPFLRRALAEGKVLYERAAA